MGLGVFLGGGVGLGFGLGCLFFLTDLCQCVLTETEMCKTKKAETAL